MHLESETRVHVPPLHFFESEGTSYAIDAKAPNWVAVDAAGRTLLDALTAAREGITFGSLVHGYAVSRRVGPGKAWVHVHDFLRALMQAGMLADVAFDRDPYPGRAALIEPDRLRELWLQVNNACNISCSHCLVSSGPGKAPGLPLERLLGIVDAAAALGLDRLFITGGEPFLRSDLVDLLEYATKKLDLEVIVLTNAMLLQGKNRKGLEGLDRSRVRFQVSIDGSRPDTNDRIRGAGSFHRALDGVRLLVDLGFDVSLTTVTTRDNLDELPEIPEVVRSVGARSQHLMWSLRRGRAAASENGLFPDGEKLLDSVLRTADAAEAKGVTLDNLEAIKRRVNGVPGIKYDLGNGGWDSLCVNFDGKAYPTAALAGESELLCGDLLKEDLRAILDNSPVIRGLRDATVARMPALEADPFRFFTGGGDWEHAWWYTGDPLGSDPYYPVTVSLIRRVMTTLGAEKEMRRNRLSGYDAPLVLHAMGEGAIACDTADASAAEKPVLTLHTNCVLSFDVDRPRAKVREFYGDAAETPKAELCCPVRYDESAVAHIPRDVLDRFYGCGSPVTLARIRRGETVVDLGSGAGIDVFIAARLVGPEGKAIGVDMTDRMLDVARENQPLVAGSLGYDVVEFREGFLEKIPVETSTVDLVTSNCVINLSPDKPRVFEEIWRVLKNLGRLVVSDIVSERDVPPRLKVNPQLWGECLVGALTQEDFLARLERAGFYGLTILKRTYWKEVEGFAFHSVTVQGFKYEKSPLTVSRGHQAVYLGPGKAIVDDEGNQFPRNVPCPISADTAAKLGKPPYADVFAVLEPGDERSGYTCCEPGDDCCS